jgi:hypothetical protein
MNLFAETGSVSQFSELHAMARAGRLASVRFMIEGGMSEHFQYVCFCVFLFMESTNFIV